MGDLAAYIADMEKGKEAPLALLAFLSQCP